MIDDNIQFITQETVFQNWLFLNNKIGETYIKIEEERPLLSPLDSESNLVTQEIDLNRLEGLLQDL
jgi:hypothetical protein